MARDRSTAGIDAMPLPPAQHDTWYLVLAQTVGEASSRVISLADGGEVVFGRGSNAQVRIDHDAVSRRHAIVRRKGATVTVEDLGSRNGTLVNGSPIVTDDS